MANDNNAIFLIPFVHLSKARVLVGTLYATIADAQIMGDALLLQMAQATHSVMPISIIAISSGVLVCSCTKFMFTMQAQCSVKILLQPRVSK